MLIDESYFVGSLTIAQLGEKSVRDNLTDVINRWEPAIMEAALGYDFYMAFLEGIDVSSDETIEQRWLDLLNGVVFLTTSSRRMRWPGFAGGQNTMTLIAAQRDDLFIYAGITPGFPVGGRSYTNSSLSGWNYTLEVFGAGTFQPVAEWDYKANGGLELTDPNYQTQYNERWVLKFTGKKTVSVPSGGQNLQSPLAGFIYYEYMRDLVTQNTGIGVVKNQGENSITMSPDQKMVDAYNSACRQMGVLYEFLQADQYKQESDRAYPEYKPDQTALYRGYWSWNGWYNDLVPYSFTPINTFNL